MEGLALHKQLRSSMDHSHSQDRIILDSYESTEHALMDSFKAAAVRVTTLYKDALAQNRKAYAAGYQQALQDLYEFITSHPNAAMLQRTNGGIEQQASRTYLPAEDLLEFARQRNAQLMSEFGQPADEATAAQNDATRRQEEHEQHGHKMGQQGFATQQPTQNTVDSAAEATTASQATPAGMASFTNQQAAIKPAFNPFQIDPDTQFTFTASPDAALSRSGIPSWGNGVYEHENVGDSLKRRHNPVDTTFMGRPLNNMHVDNWNEPPFKRGKSKRDE